jgi:hypothetical protein
MQKRRFLYRDSGGSPDSTHRLSRGLVQKVSNKTISSVGPKSRMEGLNFAAMSYMKLP